MKKHSLSRRLISTVLLIQLAGAICVTTLAFFHERQLHFRSFDILLRGRADSIFGAVQDADDVGDNLMLDGTQTSLPADDFFEVRDNNGKLLGRSPNWAGPSPSQLGAFNREASRQVEDLDDSPLGTAAVPPLASGHSDKTQAVDKSSARETFLSLPLNRETLRVVRLQGIRVVDPNEKGGKPHPVTVFYGSSLMPVQQAIVRSAGFYALSSVVVLTLTGVTMFWVLDRSLAPLRMLASAASQVSTTSWTFHAPDQARDTVELVPLIAAIESLLAGLKLAFVKQSRFVSDAAHELKTSVAVVKSSLQLLRMRPRSITDYEFGLDRSLRDFARLEDLIGQMLTLARIEASGPDAFLAIESANPVPTSQEPIPSDLTDLDAQARSTIATLAPVAELRGLEVTLVASTPVFVPIDPELLHVVLVNLLMNAIQHSPPHAPANSQITVAVGRHDRHATLRITDQGDGIPPEDLPHIFGRFRRADPSRSRNTGGTGLGLAIVKAIVDQYDGAIHISSTPGRGTEVNLQFPAADAPSLATGPHPGRESRLPIAIRPTSVEAAGLSNTLSDHLAPHS